ncbi:MAG TPA: response regulator transcription factor [Chloroflexota bacterium]|jgi:two-component system OmpR family response regulator|nr:response regulator transcription factor [Chloroflexota bacterium]
MNNERPARGRTILYVDDDSYLTDLMRYALSREGYTVQIANSGAAALRTAQAHRPDLVILDLNLPDTDGFALCSQFRTELHLPVIILSGRHSDEDIITGYDRGADDYITKPFSMHVLTYRMEAVLRRANPALADSNTKRLLRVHDGWFDTEQHLVSRNGATVKLTATESKIFQLLLTNEGQALSADRILDEIWDYDSETNVSVIKTHIRYLRSKLITIFDIPVIHTVRGLGYAFRRTPLSIPLEEAAG